MGGGDMPDDGAGVVVNVNIRTSKCKKKISVEVNLSSTVRDFKLIIAQKSAIPARRLHLTYKGRLLRNEQTLNSVANGNVILITLTATIRARSKKGRRLRGYPDFRRSFFPEFDHNGLPFDSEDNMSSYMGSVPSDDYFAAQDGSESTMNSPTPNTGGTQTKSCDAKTPDLESLSDFPHLGSVPHHKPLNRLHKSYLSAALASLTPAELYEIYGAQPSAPRRFICLTDLQVTRDGLLRHRRKYRSTDGLFRGKGRCS